MDHRDDADDDLFVDKVAAYHDDLILGRNSIVDAETPRPKDWQLRLERAQSCLRRLVATRTLDATPPDTRTPKPHDAPGLSFDQSKGTGRLGRFELRRELGRGGFGIVFLAWDPELRREVAIKVPSLEGLVDPTMRQRFLREGRAAAALSHPNLVPVYEAGAVGLVCYIVMAYCHGDTLAAWLAARREPLRPSDAARLVAGLAQAVAYMHGKGILHRDIKPGNILLDDTSELNESKAEALPFVPKLTDFGLAKAFAEDGRETCTGAVIGTPLYMAPELALGDPKVVGAACDVYSLGVILYELLAGAPPFGGGARGRIIQRVLDEEPPRLLQARPGLPPDLDAICRKCLEKSPTHRYRTAAALATDLERFLECRPTLARPLTFGQTVMRWIRRRPGAAALLGVATLVLLGYVLGAVWHFAQIVHLKTELVASSEREHGAADLARQRAYTNTMRLSNELWKAGNLVCMGETLNSQRPEPNETDLRGFEWHYLWAQSRRFTAFRGHRHGSYGLALSDDGKVCASGGGDKTIALWETASGRLLSQWPGHDAHVTHITLSRDSRQMLSASHLPQIQSPSDVKLWEVDSGRVLAQQRWASQSVNRLALSPDGRTVAKGFELPNAVEVRIWDALTGTEALVWQKPGPAYIPALRFSPDSQTLAIAHSPTREKNDAVILFDVHSHREKSTLKGFSSLVFSLAFSRDGRFLATGDDRGFVGVWDLASGKGYTKQLCARNIVSPLALSADGRLLAIGANTDPDTKPTLILWDVEDNQEIGRWEFGARLSNVAFAPDGKSVFCTCADDRVYQVSVRPVPEHRTLTGHAPNETWAVAFSPAGGILASAGDDGAVRLWDLATMKSVATLEGHGELASCLAYSPDGAWLASGSYDHTARIWNTASRRVHAVCRGHEHNLRAVAFSTDNKVLATASQDDTVKLWDVDTGNELDTLHGHKGGVRAVAFSPDGQTLATGGTDSRLILWDWKTRKIRATIEEADEVFSIAFAPDGETLACGLKQGSITRRRVADGAETSAFLGHEENAWSLTFSPDGKTLVSCGLKDLSVRLWCTRTGEELLSFTGLPSAVHGVAFSPDGQWLAAALDDGAIRLWGAGGASAGPSGALSPKN